MSADPRTDEVVVRGRIVHGDDAVSESKPPMLRVSRNPNRLGGGYFVDDPHEVVQPGESVTCRVEEPERLCPDCGEPGCPGEWKPID